MNKIIKSFVIIGAVNSMIIGCLFPLYAGNDPKFTGVIKNIVCAVDSKGLRHYIVALNEYTDKTFLILASDSDKFGFQKAGEKCKEKGVKVMSGLLGIGVKDTGLEGLKITIICSYNSESKEYTVKKLTWLK